MGPGGCVRVTTRDIWKLSSVSKSSGEIIPQIETPTLFQFTTPEDNSNFQEIRVTPQDFSTENNGQGKYYSSPPPVINITTTIQSKSIKKLPARISQSPPFIFPSKSSGSQVSKIIPMEDVSCETEKINQESTASQTCINDICLNSTPPTISKCTSPENDTDIIKHDCQLSGLEYYPDEKDQYVETYDDLKRCCICKKRKSRKRSKKKSKHKIIPIYVPVTCDSKTNESKTNQGNLEVKSPLKKCQKNTIESSTKESSIEMESDGSTIESSTSETYTSTSETCSDEEKLPARNLSETCLTVQLHDKSS